MSAIGGKADMTGCGCLLSRSLLGVKRTSPCALHMSAYDPKRTFSSNIWPMRYSFGDHCCKPDHLGTWAGRQGTNTRAVNIWTGLPSWLNVVALTLTKPRSVRTFDG